MVSWNIPTLSKTVVAPATNLPPFLFNAFAHLSCFSINIIVAINFGLFSFFLPLTYTLYRTHTPSSTES